MYFRRVSPFNLCTHSVFNHGLIIILYLNITWLHIKINIFYTKGARNLETALSSYGVKHGQDKCKSNYKESTLVGISSVQIVFTFCGV